MTINQNAQLYRELLEEKLGGYGQVDYREPLQCIPTPDPMDYTQLASERDLAVRHIDRDARAVRMIRSALQRIVTGEFGCCQDCDLPIPERRLLAVPWAERCVQCQEAADRQETKESLYTDFLPNEV